MEYVLVIHAPSGSSHHSFGTCSCKLAIPSFYCVLWVNQSILVEGAIITYMYWVYQKFHYGRGLDKNYQVYFQPISLIIP
jgi:hypothetical protein